MSDSPPPPKPKPGSLRDRIAAFEKPSANSDNPRAPPPLRPKPAGTVSWKPKPASPPADTPSFSAGAESEGGPVKGGVAGGMSASDAKESIGRGGSLKDRMAALQGRGAFGAPAAPAAPAVGTGRKWVPPPKPPVEEEAVVEIPERKTTDDGEEDKMTHEAVAKPEGEIEDKEKTEGGEGEAAEQDPEEEERQRRAAIAARMARLGGARVGMAPPVFGPKPTMPKKRASEDSQSVKSPHSEGTAASPPTSPPIPAAVPPSIVELASPATSPPPPAAEPESTQSTGTPAIEKREDDAAPASVEESPAPATSTSEEENPDVPTSPPSATTPALSPPIPALSPSLGHHTPKSMPVPAAPRRAAPPRKKRGVSPMPPARDEEGVASPEAQPKAEVKDEIKEVKEGEASVAAETEKEKEEVKEEGAIVDDVAEEEERNEKEEEEISAPPAKEEEEAKRSELPPAPAMAEQPTASTETDEVFVTPAEGRESWIGDDAPPSSDVGGAGLADAEPEDWGTIPIEVEGVRARVKEVEILPEEGGENEMGDEGKELRGTEEEEEVGTGQAVGLHPTLAPAATEAISTTAPEAEEKQEQAVEPVAAVQETREPAEALPARQESAPEERDEEVEEEAARRARVAERMAKMGGMNPFGAPRPMHTPPSRKSTAPPEEVSSPDLPESEPQEREEGEEAAAAPELTEEEEEEARKRRVREKMAKMGGFNPFAAAAGQPVPVRKDSAVSARSVGSGRKESGDDDARAGIPEVGGRGAITLTEEPQSAVEQDDEEDEAAHTAEEESPRAVPPPVLRALQPTYDEPDEEEESPPAPPPRVEHRRSIPAPPPQHAPVAVPSRSEPTAEGDEEEVSPTPPPRTEHRRSIPPPRAVPAPLAPPAEYDEEEEEQQEEEEAPPPPPARPPSDHRRSIPPPPRSVPVPPPPPPATYEAEQEEEQEEEEEEEAPPPPPPRPPSDHRRSIPPPPRSVPALRSDEEETDSAYELDPSSPPLPTNRRSQPMMRVPPPPPQLEPEYEADEEEDTLEQQSEEEPVQVPPPLPAGRHVHGASLPVRSPPPPRLEDEYEQLETPEPEAFEHIAAPVPVPAPGARRVIPPVPGQEAGSERAKPFRPTSIVTGGQAQARASPLSGSSGMLSPDSAAFEKRRQQEILEEDEGDPIDPAFHSPSRRGSTIDMEAAAALREEQAQAAPAEPVEDPEAERRRTIAERMAKLGGIRFGAPPPIPRPRQRASEDDQGTPASATQEEEQPPQNEEEEERARKERIAAKLAGMGGIRMGMMPFGAGGPAQRAPPVRGEAASPPPPPPPMRVAPPPARAPPPPQEVDSEHESLTTNSEDGVRVEAEESEIEEIRHEDAEEEVPPPVPSRAGGHRTSMASPIVPSSPPIPSSRPPVPSAMPPNRRASSQMASTPTSRKASAEAPPVPSANPRRTSTMNKPPAQEFVMVDSDEPPPPPPARPSSRPPPRGVPPPPQDVAPSDSIDSMSSSQWELPSLSTGSIDFGGGIDTTFDVEATTSPPPPPKPAHPESSQRPPAPKATEVHYSSDDLVAIWGRVGVHLCEAATQLYEKSKKSLIGDGTYSGFVNAALHEVPNAARSTPPTWGYLIYSQSGGSVQKRLSDIMPGDVVALFDAKLKGHKGLSTYSQTVGAGEPLVGIVSEFEPKKSKIRVFQANQHVGQQTVEAASYRLEDLKSGIVKVYRVLEA